MLLPLSVSTTDRIANLLRIYLICRKEGLHALFIPEVDDGEVPCIPSLLAPPRLAARLLVLQPWSRVKIDFIPGISIPCTNHDRQLIAQ